MWTYLALIVHVFEKDPMLHNGWESYVAERIEDKDTSFLPRNTALVLQEAEEADQEAMNVVMSRIDGIDDTLEKMRSTMDMMLKEQQPGRQPSTGASRREIQDRVRRAESREVNRGKKRRGSLK